MPIKRQVKKGQTILYQGEVPSSVFVIKKGLVRALNVDSRGEEHTISLYGPGDYFPVEFAFGKSPAALLYYESMTKASMDLYSRDEFKESLKKTGEIEINKLATQYVSSLLRINALGYNLARDRVAHTLQYLALRFGRETRKKGSIKINLQLTHLDIARMAGLTRETTAIEIGRLKKSGTIKARRKYYTIVMKDLLKSIDNDEFDEVEL